MYDQNGLKMYDYGDGMNAGLSRPFMTNFNALQGVQLDKNLSNGNAFTGTAFADVKLFSDLTATFNIGTNLDDVRFNSMYNPYYGQFAASGGMVSVQTQRTFEINAQQLLNYSHTFAGKHRVSAMVGHEFYNLKTYLLSGTKEQMFSIGNLELKVRSSIRRVLPPIRPSTTTRVTSAASSMSSTTGSSSTVRTVATLRRASTPTTAGATSGRPAPHGSSTTSRGSMSIGWTC